MVSSVAATSSPVLMSGYNTLMALLSVAVLCLLIQAATGEVPSDVGTANNMAQKNLATPLNCPACPKQIAICDSSRDSTGDVKPIECNNGNARCSSCDELLPIVRAQLNMNNRILRQLDEMRNYTPSVDPETNPSTLTNPPRDCKEVQTAGYTASGRYAVYPDDGEDPFFVFCDMVTDGGGWTVFQRRHNALVDFYQTWTDYKYGFGSVEGNHWLGNEKIHRLTSQKLYELRVDLADFEGNTRYAEYDQFLLGDEGQAYQLIIGVYSGDAGGSPLISIDVFHGAPSDSLSSHHGMRFSAKDRDMDMDGSHHCAELRHGAWWYNACTQSNLNGDYLGGPTSLYATGVVWYKWKGQYYSLKETEMKIRPLD